MRRGIVVVGAVLALVVAACGGGGSQEPAAATSGGETTAGDSDTRGPAGTEAPAPPQGTVEGPAVWVAGNEGGTLLRYDTALHQMARVDDTLDGVDLFLTSYATVAAGRLWLSYSGDSDQLIGVDPDTMKVTSATDLPDYPIGLYPGPGRVWVTYGIDGMLTEVTADGSAVAVDVDGAPHLLIDNGDSGWLFDSAENRLYAFRPDGPAAELAVDDLSTGEPMSVAEVGSELWAAVTDGLDTLMRIDPVAGEVNQIWCAADTGACEAYPDEIAATFGLEGGIEFGEDLLAVDGKIWARSPALTAFVGDPMTVYVIDPETLTVTRTAELPLAVDMVSTPDGVYLVSVEELGETGCGRVYRVDPDSLEVTDQTDLPPEVCADAIFYG